MAANDIYRFRFEYALGPQAMSFGIYYREVSGTYSIAALAQILDALRVAFEAKVRNCLSEDLNISKCSLINQTNTVSINLTHSFSGINNGNVDEDSLPLESCAVIKLQTNAAEGKNNGRVYLSGLPETFTDDTVFDAAALAILNVLANQFSVNVGPSATGTLLLEPVVCSRVLNGNPRPTPVYNKITSATTRSTPHLQRRRKRKAAQLLQA